MKTWFVCTRSLVAIIAVLLSVMALPGVAAPNDTVIPMIKFEGVPLGTAIESLARQAEVSFLIDPKTGLGGTPVPDQKPEPRLSFTWTNLTAEQALTGLLAYYGMHQVEIAGTPVVKITLTNATTRPVDTEWIRSGTNSSIPLIQFNGVPLDTALENLAKQDQLNIILDKKLARELSGQLVSARLQHITLRQAIAALCDNYDLRLLKGGSTNLITITKPETNEKKATPVK